LENRAPDKTHRANDTTTKLDALTTVRVLLDLMMGTFPGVG